jgi:hypothetical protein
MAELTRREQVQRRWNSLKSERAGWVGHWKQISDHLLPRTGRFFTSDTNRGDRRWNNIYDSTGTRALNTLAAGLMAGMTSPARPWFRLQTADTDMMEFGPVKEWLALVSRIMLDIYARSNTYRALHGLYEELGAYGTASTIVVPDFDTVLHHHPQTCGEYALASNSKGQIDTFVREFRLTTSQMIDWFGVDAVPDNCRAAYQRSQLDTWWDVIHLIEPRRDREASNPAAQHKPWSSCYYCPSDNNRTLRESGFDRFPVLAPRWVTRGGAGDVYGFSPGMEALGDVKQLQHQQLRKAQGIDYQTKPPLQAPSALKHHEVDSLPGGISFVDAASPQGGIRTQFEVNLRLDHLLGDIQDTRQRIKSAFYEDLFLLLANDERSNVTAYEIAKRQEEKLMMLGPVLERLHNELLEPLVDMTFERVISAGIAPPPPQELQGAQLNVEFVSVLAQAQRAIGTAGVDRLLGTVAAVAQLKPEVLDKLDGDQLVDAYADMLGVEPSLIVPDDKVALIRKDRQAQQQAANMAAMAKPAADMAQAAKTASEVQPGGGLMGLFSGYTQ